MLESISLNESIILWRGKESATTTGASKILIFCPLRSYCYNIMTLNSAYLIVKHFGKLRDFLQFLGSTGGLGCIICEIWQGTSNLRRGSGVCMQAYRSTRCGSGVTGLGLERPVQPGVDKGGQLVVTGQDPSGDRRRYTRWLIEVSLYKFVMSHVDQYTLNQRVAWHFDAFGVFPAVHGWGSPHSAVSGTAMRHGNHASALATGQVG